jgi:hypothetical protein
MFENRMRSQHTDLSRGNNEKVTRPKPSQGAADLANVVYKLSVHESPKRVTRMKAVRTAQAKYAPTS